MEEEEDNNNTINSTTPTPTSIPPECKLAADVILNPYCQFSRILLIMFNLGAFFQLIPLALRYRAKHVTLHGNLKLIYLNIVVMYCIVGPASYLMIEFRHLYLSVFSASQPCQMLIPLWFIIFSKVIAYAFVVAIPLLHFVAIIERIRATVLAQNYECEGIRFGVGMLTIVYSITGLFCAYLTYTSLLENGFQLDKHFPVNIFTNKYNAGPLIVLFYAQLGIVMLTTACSYFLLRLNKKLDRTSNRFSAIRGDTVGYSLSWNYQLRENLQTMGLIFPLDLAYFLFLSLYISLIVILRTINEQSPMATPIFMAHYNMILLIPTFYSTLELIYYRRFLVNKGQPLFGASNAVGPAGGDDAEGGQAELYFKQLRSQWN